jgi:hypothetical protein
MRRVCGVAEMVVGGFWLLSACWTRQFVVLLRKYYHAMRVWRGGKSMENQDTHPVDYLHGLFIDDMKSEEKSDIST